MFPTPLLVSVLLALSTAVAASPVLVTEPRVSLPIVKRFNFTGTASVLESDLARARGFRTRTESRRTGNRLNSDAVVSFPVENQAVTYVASVGVGSPATTYTLLIDTGSSNTWVGASKAYVRTSTSRPTLNLVSVTYGSGFFAGEEFMDTVTLAPDLVITGQSIGAAVESEGFEGLDGILGLGPVDLTEGTLIPAGGSSIPTVTDNLFSQGTITADQVSVSFEPTTQETVTNGELTFGGIDSSKFTGPLTFAPITDVSPSSEFWGISQSIQYGTSTPILAETAGIVDTGTTLVLLASDAFDAYTTATGAVEDQTTGLLRLTTAQFANLESLFFTINGVTFEFTPNAQAWPRVLNADIGGTVNNVYLIVGNLGTPSGEGMDFINGFAFLERFYSVFDTANQQVGFATTEFTNATTN